MAARSPRFLEMAVDMALSLREHTAHPIALAADEGLADVARSRYAKVFDHVTVVSQRFREGRSLKYGSAEASPFEETAFVDADCLVLGSLDAAFEALEACDMAMTGEQLGPHENRKHHGFSTSVLIRRFGLDTYLKTNSGFFCFRRSEALAIMEDCRTCYLEEVVPQLRWQTILGRWLGDELAFGIVGGRRGLGTLSKPDVMYWPEEFATIDLEHPTKPLLHMIWPPSPETLAALLRGTAARREAAGVPGGAEAHWREEVRRLGHLAGHRRLIELFRKR